MNSRCPARELWYNIEMKILGIETSCDETAAAVVRDGVEILSNVVVSQVDIHAVYGGVVPEIAARSHIEAILPVVRRAMDDAGVDWEEIDGIAVTHEPGLLGSLLMGTLAARTLNILHDKPLYAEHHLKSHIYANWLTDGQKPEFPLVALVVSGGHTQLIKMRGHGDFEIVGTTRDDAVGEVFDKVAKILGLSYPGGPAIGEAALRGDARAYDLPIPKVEGYDFSFSGLKTAVLRAVQKELGVPISAPSGELAGLLRGQQVADFAASFQEVAAEVLVQKLSQVLRDDAEIRSVVLAGGVSANRVLRERVRLTAGDRLVFVPEMNLCTDNAAMVGAAAYYSIEAGQGAVDPYDLDIAPRSKIS